MTPVLEGLGLVELLDFLEPVPQPPPIPLTPQTAGWLWLGLLIVILAFLAVRKAIKHRQANAYRRAALQELASVGDNAAKIASILRRTALAGFPRESVAGLLGKDWLAFLNRTYSGRGFSDDPGEALLTAPYRSNFEEPDLNKIARDWTRSHKRSTEHG